MATSTRELAKLGLLISNLNQITRSIEFEPAVRLPHTGCLGSESIGAFSYIGPGSEIKNAGIGRFCSIARNVAIGPPEHPIDWVSSHPVQYDGLRWFSDFESWERFLSDETPWKGNSKKTVVGNDVWIGRNVIVRQGVTVGNGAIIGANSFVNADVPPYAIVAGNPASLIRYRFDETIIERLQDAEWWNWKPPVGEKYKYADVRNFLDDFFKKKTNGRLSRFTPDRYRVTRVAGDLSIKMLSTESP
ncbi:CatB-related O-acetyltransferase [Pontiellaceae bacterium B12219]|nr:CatB-related O-acetyltransferase [Pontiellaceae bacterium B12219]